MRLRLFQFRIDMFSVAAKHYLHTNRLFLMLAMSSLPNISITSSTGKELNIFELKVIYTEYGLTHHDITENIVQDIECFNRDNMRCLETNKIHSISNKNNCIM